MVNNHGDRKSPKDRVVGPLPNGRTSWLINGGDPKPFDVDVFAGNILLQPNRDLKGAQKILSETN